VWLFGINPYGRTPDGDSRRRVIGRPASSEITAQLPKVSITPSAATATACTSWSITATK
jgi:hypothetical protein